LKAYSGGTIRISTVLPRLREAQGLIQTGAETVLYFTTEQLLPLSSDRRNTWHYCRKRRENMAFFVVQKGGKKVGFKEVVSNIGSCCTRAIVKTISLCSSSH